MAREHVIDPSVVHHQWDLDLEPLLAIDSGDTVHFDIMVAGEGQVWPGASYEDTRFDFDTIYNLSGPIWVNGAEPGDTLQVDVLDLRHGDWGWAAFLPGFGLLPDDFPHGYVRTFELKDFGSGIRSGDPDTAGTVLRHDRDPSRGAEEERAVPAAPGLREHRQPAPDVGIDGVDTGARAGSDVFRRGPARGPG